ncbi:ATP-binding protein [Nostoc sp. FACHB-87]|uniref:ATP-binding protein n=1 Tax=Nostocales TaxID=1161 RepID=UPI00168253AD|nr:MULTISPECIES: ATP-binding protein [Nostocales]MBD2459097.1 ATP-binding protein [Nostoc sp. FACHB-87]MBD2480114.1 ATP-binding protein [Anabaena sp. FACHB-83]MBD2488431.1 ATP-binding protein [Aulosira sp. FACHB-615]
MSDNSRVINAEPTKDLFIYMLVRDIPLIRAIIDLVDNSVDGATHLQSNENYEGLWIKILANKEYFQIQDNCGGITVKEAEEYAFKFGRANDAAVTPKSIGRFGIGMKRAFFKIGKKFTVQSTTSSSKFVVSEDVDEWKNKDEWTFEFLEVQEDGDYESSEIGTRILIEQLHESVSEDLGLENFLSQLRQELTIAYSLKIKKGLSISINNEDLRPTPLNFRTSDNIKVAKFEKEYKYFGSHEIDTPVRVSLYAGVSDRNLNEGGWYVFCNERMVLEADQTEIMGWGTKSGFPKYHADFAFFRGYAFFESDDAAYLPWTTTKTGIDYDSPIYKSIKQEVSELTVPVLTFLRKMADEKSRVERGEISESLLERAYLQTSIHSVFEVDTSTTFQLPEQSAIPPRQSRGTIQYNKPTEDIERVKELLNVSSNKDVGEKTFDYYLNNEG